MKDLGPTLSIADKVAEAPTSLATAAAIARGDSLPMGPPAPLTRARLCLQGGDDEGRGCYIGQIVPSTIFWRIMVIGTWDTVQAPP